MSKRIKRILMLVLFLNSIFFILESINCSFTGIIAYAEGKRPSLKSIYLSEGDNIRFKEDVHTYAVDVDKDKTEAFIKARPDDPEDIVKIDSEVVTKDDFYKKELSLDKGKNIVEIKVEDSVTKSETKYTIYIYRGGKDAVYLNNINIDGNTIGFNKEVNNYNIELDKGTDIVELETVPEDPDYSVSVNGRELDDTDSIKLKFKGVNKYTLNIEVKDNYTQRIKDYTLDVYLGIPVSPDVPNAIKSVLKPNQWVIVNGRWRYNDSLGISLKNAWYYDENYSKYFHFNGMGNMQIGWIEDGDAWYYLNSKGEMQTGWLENENNWYYLNDNGSMQTGWKLYDGKWYYFNQDGSMVTGWIVNNNRWYYLNSDGSMQTDWMKYAKKWYYFSNSGAMQTGWVQSNDDWYYLNLDGTMKSGEWVYYNNNWYYITYYGSMYKGDWLSKDDKSYYFNDDGTMRKEPLVYEGYMFAFNDDGSLNLN